MKKIVKKAALLSCIAVFGLGITNAQESEKREGLKKARTEFKESLTDVQKKQLAQQKITREKQREIMSATYSKEQLALVESKDLNRREKHKALKETMTPAQKKLSKKQREVVNKEKEIFRASLTEDQKKQLALNRKSKGKKGKRHRSMRGESNLEKGKRSKKSKDGEE